MIIVRGEHQAQEKNYAFLLELQKYALTLVKEGAVVKDVVSKVADYVREKKPELADFLVKPFGARVRPVSICSCLANHVPLTLDLFLTPSMAFILRRRLDSSSGTRLSSCRPRTARRSRPTRWSTSSCRLLACRRQRARRTRRTRSS